MREIHPGYIWACVTGRIGMSRKAGAIPAEVHEPKPGLSESDREAAKESAENPKADRPGGAGNGRIRPDPGPRLDRRHRHSSYDGQSDLECLLQRRRRAERVGDLHRPAASVRPVSSPYFNFRQAAVWFAAPSISDRVLSAGPAARARRRRRRLPERLRWPGPIEPRPRETTAGRAERGPHS